MLAPTPGVNSKIRYIITLSARCTYKREREVKVIIVDTGKLTFVTYCLLLRMAFEP